MTALVVLILCWLAGWATLARIKPCRRTVTKPLPPNTKLSVIIPARNEEKNLPRLLRSLQSQSTPPEEIIVVDDGSTDRTAAVAAELGARVVTPPPLPEGWRGKPGHVSTVPIKPKASGCCFWMPIRGLNRTDWPPCAQNFPLSAVVRCLSRRSITSKLCTNSSPHFSIS